MLQNNQRIIVKVVLGFAVIVSLFFITVKIIHEKLSKLAETVTTILEPNLKLIELKEISGCLYEAEANVKAYSIRKDTVYLANYESQIQILYSHLDTLQYLAAKQMKIVTPAQAATNKVFSTQIDTLRVLILARVNLFEEYIELKTGLKSGDFLVQVAQKMEANRRMAENSSSQSAVPKEKSYFRRLFKSKKNLSENNISPTTGTSDSLQNNLQNIIKEAQFAANRIKGQELSKETDIAQREFLISNKFFSLINIMEEKVLVEKINVINKATAETSSKISFISSWLAILGLIIAIMFANFIYRDIRSSKQYKLGILLTKREAEKSAAQYSRSLIEASRDPLVTISHDGKITDMNEALVRITGISRRVLTGTDFISLFSDPQKAGDGYQRVFQNGFVTDFPLTIGGTEGKLTEVLFNGAVYKNEVEIVLGAVVVARDVTDQRIFEKEMIEAKTQAEQATKRAEDSTQLIEAFLANMSHEIRTPMNAIIGFSELLTSLELGKKEIKYANAIKSAGESLMVIINDILDMSKIEAGMMTFEEDSFSIIETSDFQDFRKLKCDCFVNQL
ncbi:MAG: PAS domain-containing protein [Bacteroidetes bacterium]|nr:PAS domain-containing protein [Bacteroidota bacterium]MBU1719550.1 PAS domain-containing protein [Bacteroidota bacterium]